MQRPTTTTEKVDIGSLRGCPPPGATKMAFGVPDGAATQGQEIVARGAQKGLIQTTIAII